MGHQSSTGRIFIRERYQSIWRTFIFGAASIQNRVCFPAGRSSQRRHQKYRRQPGRQPEAETVSFLHPRGTGPYDPLASTLMIKVDRSRRPMRSFWGILARSLTLAAVSIFRPANQKVKGIIGRWWRPRAETGVAW